MSLKKKCACCEGQKCALIFLGLQFCHKNLATRVGIGGWGGRYRPDDHVVDTTLSLHVPPTRKRAGKALQGANVQGVGKAL